MARIYISYSPLDLSSKELSSVERLVEILKSAGHEVWFPEDPLHGGAEPRGFTNRIMMEMDVCLVFMTSRSLRSEALRRDVRSAYDLDRRIIPIYLHKRISALIPSVLAERVAVDLSHDFRDGARKLLAGLRGQARTRGEPREMEEPPEPTPEIPIAEAETEEEKWSPDLAGDEVIEEEDSGAEIAEELRRRSGARRERAARGARGSTERGGMAVPSDKDAGLPGRSTTRRQPQPAKVAESPAPRYANVTLLQAKSNYRLRPSNPIGSLSLFRIRLDIGRLSRLSAVRKPVALPEKYLPRGIWLDVVLSSTDFQVGSAQEELGESNVVQGRFFLPKDGGPALTEDRKKYLYFTLRAPELHGPARARIGYYYRNHLVQSQLLVVRVGRGASRFTVDTDYTLSRSLAGLERLPRRHQLSILTNDNGNGTHQIIIREQDRKGNLLEKPLTFEVNTDAVGKVVQDLRFKLRNEPIAPTERKRSREQLKEDLKTLAPLGRKLYSAIPGRYAHQIYPLLDEKENLVVQVTRPTSSSFTFPWGLVYDIELESTKEWKYCPLVERWNDKGDLFAGDAHECPEAKVHESNTLCPFGFWGYRYAIEQLSRTDEPALKICPPPAFEMLVGETQYNVDEDDLKAHVNGIRSLLKNAFPKASLLEGNDFDSIKALLPRETPLIYFYCHGERPQPNSPETFLGVGDRQSITSDDFIGWVQAWWRVQKKKVWDIARVRPLIFINACHSVDISPDSLVSYLDAFIGTGHAAGVIGTEVRVVQELAMEAALVFLTSFLQQNSVAQALHKMRMSFLRSGNLFGLVYTPYCWSDLKLTRS